MIKVNKIPIEQIFPPINRQHGSVLSYPINVGLVTWLALAPWWAEHTYLLSPLDSALSRGTCSGQWDTSWHGVRRGLKSSYMVWFVSLYFCHLLGIATQDSCCYFSFGLEGTYMKPTWAQPAARSQGQQEPSLKAELPRQGQLVNQLNCSPMSVRISAYCSPSLNLGAVCYIVSLHQELTNTMVSSSETSIIYSESCDISHSRDSCLGNLSGQNLTEVAHNV